MRKVILFDIDGTLVNTGGAGRDALHTALAMEFAVTNPHRIDLSGRTDRGICRELFEVHEIEHTPENWERFQRAYLVGLAQHLTERQGFVLPGVHELIGRLKQQTGVAIGLLTGNVREGARRKLLHYGLDEHFVFGGFGDVHHERDDVARAALLAAQEHCGAHVGGEHIWVIGDTPLDIRCARAIGAKVVAVGTGAFTAEQLRAFEPELAVENLASTNELMEVLVAEQ
jgi:phosphoglycolate phosphatase-like HAD superfamily hydrolase